MRMDRNHIFFDHKSNLYSLAKQFWKTGEVGHSIQMKILYIKVIIAFYKLDFKQTNFCITGHKRKPFSSNCWLDHLLAFWGTLGIYHNYYKADWKSGPELSEWHCLCIKMDVAGNMFSSPANGLY
jgi:hypothetical protein